MIFTIQVSDCMKFLALYFRAAYPLPLTALWKIWTLVWTWGSLLNGEKDGHMNAKLILCLSRHYMYLGIRKCLLLRGYCIHVSHLPLSALIRYYTLFLHCEEV